jgi:hypothetical protein
LSLALIEKVTDAMVAADGEARRGPTWAVVDDVVGGLGYRRSGAQQPGCPAHSGRLLVTSEPPRCWTLVVDLSVESGGD